MSAMPTTIEGTWEEISRHAKQFQGRKLRLTVVDPEPIAEPVSSLERRRAFLRLPKKERDRLFAEQAEILAPYYENDTEWREWLAGDIIDVTEQTTKEG